MGTTGVVRAVSTELGFHGVQLGGLRLLGGHKRGRAALVELGFPCLLNKGLSSGGGHDCHPRGVCSSCWPGLWVGGASNTTWHLPLLSVGSGPQRGSEVMMRCCALTARTGAGCPRLFTGQDAGCLKLGAGWSQEEEKEVWTSTPVDQTTFHHVEAADV